MKNAIEIFRFLLEAGERGERCVLVTLTEVTGGSSRAPGTHMAVTASGEWIGSLSGGCVEAAVVAEALAVLGRGQAEIVRFGAGSRYIDIRLPCGGGIDLLFTPDPSPEIIAEALTLLQARQGVTLALGVDGDMDMAPTGLTGWAQDTFLCTHEPDLRLIVVGHGAEVVALASLAHAYGAQIEVLSPDQATLGAVEPYAASLFHLVTPRSTDAIVGDEHSAFVFLFHDHDWEPAMMAAALQTQAFFIGAMGSRRTHEQRQALLIERGICAAQVARIVGPIGLIHSTRDPATLALSVLAQVVSAKSGSAAHGEPRPLTDTAEHILAEGGAQHEAVI